MQKRAFLVISLLILLGNIFPGYGVLAGEETTPHEDPALAREEAISLPMVLHYGNAYELADLKKYLEAGFQIGEMDFAAAPSDLTDVIERFNMLSSDIFIGMDSADKLVQKSASLLERGELNQARQAVSEAVQSNDETQKLIEEVLATADIVGGGIDVFAAAASPALRQAYQGLLGGDVNLARQLLRETGLSDAETEQLLSKVSTEPGLVGDKIGAFSQGSSPELRQAYEGLLESILKLKGFNIAPLLEEIAVKEQTIIATEVTLEVTPLSVFVGDIVTASGRLAAQGVPLGGRAITVTLEGTPSVIQTEADGAYLLSITVPYNYFPSMTLQVTYSPEGADKDAYQGCQSEPVNIKTLFYETGLDINTPVRGSPDLPLILSGRVSSTGPVIDRSIAIAIDGIQWAQGTGAGVFKIENTLPAALALGAHGLTASVAPHKRYAGTSQELSLDVVLLPVEVDLDVPSWTWAPHRVTLKGYVHSGATDVNGASVALLFRGETVSAVTGPDGQFAVDLDMPLGASLAGPQDFSLDINPQQPYYESLSKTERIFTLNLIGLGLIVAAFIALAFFWRRLHRYLARGQKARSPDGTVPEAILAPDTVLKRDLPLPLTVAVREPGPQGRIVAAYLDALKVVERAVSISMTHHMTLREFFNLARTGLSDTTVSSFMRLTSVTELALYSDYSLGDDLVQEAQRLAADIQGERLP
jgi:hypothetical protein